MRSQTQSMLESISHFPSIDPPQGPFSILLGQRETGQNPPNKSSIQSPHMLHRFSNSLARFISPKNNVSLPAMTSAFSIISDTVCMPLPHARTRILFALFTSSLYFRRMRLSF